MFKLKNFQNVQNQCSHINQVLSTTATPFFLTKEKTKKLNKFKKCLNAFFRSDKSLHTISKLNEKSKSSLHDRENS